MLRVGQRVRAPSPAPPSRARSHLTHLGAGAGGAARTGFPRAMFSSPFAFKNGRRMISMGENGGAVRDLQRAPASPNGSRSNTGRTPAARCADSTVADSGGGSDGVGARG